jgi:hypothetical protein
MLADKELENFVQSLKDEYDDYNQSVEGLYIFASVVRYDPKANKYCTGSKMKIPAKFYVKDDSQKNPLTPDGVVQRSNEEAIVFEMKKHFNNDEGKDFDQIKKYDETLIDFWIDDELPYHDLVLLTHYTSGTRASDAYKLWVQNNKYLRNFAIVVFNSTAMGNFYYTLELKEGMLSNSELMEALRRVLTIPNRVFEEIKSKYKFYDSDPPLIYTMQVIYDQLLPTLFDDTKENSLSGEHLEISVKYLRDRLQELFNSNESNHQENNIPKLKWVSEAIDKFVEIGLAKKIDNDKYLIKMARTKEDTKEFIAKRIYKVQSKRKLTKSKMEPTLFDQFEKER